MRNMRTNPIAQRLQMLSDQWAQFAGEPQARLLCWQLTAAELPMFEAFLEQESDERSAEHADVFVTLDTPFASADDYGAALCRTLADGYSQGTEELRARTRGGLAATGGGEVRNRTSPTCCGYARRSSHSTRLRVC